MANVVVAMYRSADTKMKSIAICIAIESKKKILQYRQQYHITKSIGNMEAILKKVLPIILQYF